MSIGKIGPFDVAKDVWDSYVERLEQYFIANDVKEAVKVATLITVIGSEAYELMVNLCTPEKPSTKSFSDLVTVMKGHLQPRPSLLAERFRFRQRVQKEEEMVPEYLTELKRLSKDCKFVASSLAENIRDQFVCGLKNENIRQRLFAEDDNITLEKAFKLAVAMETAESDAALMEDRTRAKKNDGLSTTSVNQLRSAGRSRGQRNNIPHGVVTHSARDKPTRASAGGRSGAEGSKGIVNRFSSSVSTSNMRCNVCGGQHEATVCKFRYYVCRVCNREGHLKKMCPKVRNESSKCYNMIEERVRSESDSEDNMSEEDAIAPLSRFRILAPEFVCPKDEDAVIEKPDNTVITLQSSVGAELQVQWTVRWKPLQAPTQRFTLMLWKTVRALEAKLNGPQPEPLVYVIENSKLLSGVDYIFNVSEVGQDVEPKSFHIDNVQGNQKLLIEGRNDMMSVILVGGQETYVDLEFNLEAQVTSCFPTQDYYFVWTVTSEFGDDVEVSHIFGSKLLIPRDSLQAGSTYDVSCQLFTYTDEHIITQTGIAFKVPPRGIEAYLNFDYLVVSADQPFSVEATVVNHDNYDDVSLQWICTYEGEKCDYLYNATGNVIEFPTGLPDLGDYHISLNVGVMNKVVTTNATVTSVAPELPVVQIHPVQRILNEGTMVSLTANATNVPPTCSLTWYFASQEYLFYNQLVVNETCEERQHGEPLTDTLTIQSLEENFLNELIDYTNETQWRQVATELEAAAGRARFVAQCGCSLTFNCDRKGVVYADVQFELNTSPMTGNLMITPDSGTAMETVFRISTLPASDPDGILRYNFFCRVGPEDVLLLASYVEHRAVETLLPYMNGGTEVWIEVCDALGACSAIEATTVTLSPGEARTLSMLTADADAHVRRCEMLLLTRVAVSVIVTYVNAVQPEPLADFKTALLQSLKTIDDSCVRKK